MTPSLNDLYEKLAAAEAENSHNQTPATQAACYALLQQLDHYYPRRNYAVMCPIGHGLHLAHVHRLGCPDVNGPKYRGVEYQQALAANPQDAFDCIVDPELGYTFEQDCKVFACCEQATYGNPRFAGQVTVTFTDVLPDEPDDDNTPAGRRNLDRDASPQYNDEPALPEGQSDYERFARDGGSDI